MKDPSDQFSGQMNISNHFDTFSLVIPNIAGFGRVEDPCSSHLAPKSDISSDTATLMISRSVKCLLSHLSTFLLFLPCKKLDFLFSHTRCQLSFEGFTSHIISVQNLGHFNHFRSTKLNHRRVTTSKQFSSTTSV